MYCTAAAVVVVQPNALTPEKSGRGDTDRRLIFSLSSLFLLPLDAAKGSKGEVASAVLFSISCTSFLFEHSVVAVCRLLHTAQNFAHTVVVGDLDAGRESASQN